MNRFQTLRLTCVSRTNTLRCRPCSGTWGRATAGPLRWPSPSDSSIPALSTQSSSADWVIPETVAISRHQEGPHEVPVPGPIPGTVIPVCESGIRSSWQNKLVLRPGISPNPPIPASLMAFKLAVVVSTIAVKRSNRAASLEVGRNGDKRTPLTSTSGRGRHGRRSVCLILLLRSVGSNVNCRDKVTKWPLHEEQDVITTWVNRTDACHYSVTINLVTPYCEPSDSHNQRLSCTSNCHPDRQSSLTVSTIGQIPVTTLSQ